MFLYETGGLRNGSSRSVAPSASTSADPDPGTLRGGAVNPRAPRPSARVPTHGRVARPAAVLRKRRRRVRTRSVAAQARDPIEPNGYVLERAKDAARTWDETEGKWV